MSRSRIAHLPAIRSTALHRPRLLQLLPQPGDARLLLVHGPAGTGKTTLVAQWMEALPVPMKGAWVSLHEGTQDRAELWSAVILTLRDLGLAAPGSRLESFNLETLTGPSARSALVRVLASVRSPLVLVIDDYHHLEDRETDSDILAVLAAVPSLSIVVLSRTRSGLNRMEVRARLDTAEVHSRCFAFTAKETRSLAERFHTSRVAADAIHGASGGWPLGTIAMFLEAADGTRSTRTAAQRSLFVEEYVETILAKVEPTVRDLLLATARFPEFSCALLSEFLGKPESEVEELLVQLERDGITTRRRVRGEFRFQHHPALREAIARRSVACLAPRDHARMVRVYALWIEDDRPHEALALLCSIGDYAAANALTIRHISTLTTIYALSTLRTLIQIPLEVAQNYVVLLSARFLIQQADPNVPVAWLNEILTRIRKQTMERWAAGEAKNVGELAILTGMERMMGHSEQASAFASMTGDLLSDVGAPPSNPLRRAAPLMHAIVALTALLNGRLNESRKHFHLCERSGAELGMAYERVRGFNGLALTESIDGNLRTARSHANAALEAMETPEWEDHFGGFNLRLAKTALALEKLDLSTAREEALRLAEREHVMESWPLLAMLVARLDLLEAGPRAALAHFRTSLRRNRERPNPLPHVRAQLAAVSAGLEARAGNLSRAERILSSALENHPDVLIADATISLLSGKLRRAATRAEYVVRSVELAAYPTRRARISAQLILANVAWIENRRRDVEEQLESISQAIQETGLHSPLTVIPHAALLEISESVGNRLDDELISLIQCLPTGVRLNSSSPLSKTEQRILETISLEGTVDRAAEKLVISPNTVKFHLKRIYRKLGVNTRAEALARAQEMGLHPPVSTR